MENKLPAGFLIEEINKLEFSDCLNLHYIYYPPLLLSRLMSLLDELLELGFERSLAYETYYH